MSEELHVIDSIPAYALGCLEADEAGAVAEHLIRCSLCRSELQRYEQLTADLTLAVPTVAPSTALADKLMAQIRPIKDQPAISKSGWANLGQLFASPKPIWAVIGLVIIVLSMAGNLVLWSRLNTPTPTPRPDVFRTIPLFPTDASPEAHGMIVISLDGDEGALVVEDLEPLAAGQHYQLWFAEADQRTRGPAFTVDPDGYQALMISSPRPLDVYSGFGITVEPATDTPAQPSGDRVLRWGTEKGRR